MKSVVLNEGMSFVTAPVIRSPDYPPRALSFLNQLRLTAMGCRAMPRADLFEACALLKVQKTETRDAHAQALMRCLSDAFGKPARLHAPGTSELTFDERWLMQLGIACHDGDDDSQRFLLNSRIAAEDRRLVRYLVGRTAEFCFLDGMSDA